MCKILVLQYCMLSKTFFLGNIIFSCFSHGSSKDPNPFDDESEEWDEGDAGNFSSCFNSFVKMWRCRLKFLLRLQTKRLTSGCSGFAVLLNLDHYLILPMARES